jgi:hypothetical protein
MFRARMGVLFLLMFALPSTAFAAFMPAPVYVGIRATPEYPAPNSPVTLSASTARSAGEYSYAWFVDGELVAEGVDITSISIQTKNAGEETVIALEITDVDGVIRGTTDYVIQPGSVDVLWEGQTYTPPFYHGRPYPNNNSIITLEAVPHLFSTQGRFNKNELVYLWEVDGKAVPGKSGYGKSTIKVTPSRFKNATTVRLTVESRDGVHAARTSVIVPSVRPIFAFYEKKPLLGVSYERAVEGTYRLQKEEATFEVVPFFVNNPASLQYTWALDRVPFAVDASAPRTATLRKQGAGGGIFSVEVSGERADALYDRGSAGFRLSLE